MANGEDDWDQDIERLSREQKAKRSQEIEQGMTMLAEQFPATWRRLYKNLRLEGFVHEDAMDLLKTFILSCGGRK